MRSMMDWRIWLLGVLGILLILPLTGCSSIPPIRVDGIARYESSPNHLTLVLSPTSELEPGKVYPVEVWEAGKLRSRCEAVWTQTELNVEAKKYWNFPARKEEIKLYPIDPTAFWNPIPGKSKDLKEFFEVKWVGEEVEALPREIPAKTRFQWWWILASLVGLVLLFFLLALLNIIPEPGKGGYEEKSRLREAKERIRKLELRPYIPTRPSEPPKEINVGGYRPYVPYSRVPGPPKSVIQELLEEDSARPRRIKEEEEERRQAEQVAETKKREEQKKQADLEEWKRRHNLQEVIKAFKPSWRWKTTPKGKDKRRLEGDEKGTTANLARYLRGKDFKAETEISFPDGRKADLVVNGNTIIEAKPNLMFPGRLGSLMQEVQAHRLNRPNYKVMVVIYGDARGKYLSQLRHSVGEAVPTVVLGGIK